MRNLVNKQTNKQTDRHTKVIAISRFSRDNNDVVTPRISRCMLIGFRFQPFTELFYILDTRQSAR